ncbi:MAG: hypothetical protein N4A44_02430 [Alphaproteobacteria bacterium]|nr:hypothetical protein [Alphaproteobacteria bacterium]
MKKINLYILTFMSVFCIQRASFAEEEIVIEEFSEEMIDETSSPFNENIDERVKSFDISNIKLGMKIKDVRKAIKKLKFKEVKSKTNVPEFFKYNYDLECRNRNILKPDNLEMCINSFARRDNIEYVQLLQFKKADSDEAVDIYFTSNLTGNVVYKIQYKNDLNKILGDGKNFKYQREENRRAFWYKVVKKYGEPNVEGDLIWRYDVSNEKSVTLKASFEGLILESTGMNEQDTLEGIQKAREMFKPNQFTF